MSRARAATSSAGSSRRPGRAGGFDSLSDDVLNRLEACQPDDRVVAIIRDGTRVEVQITSVDHTRVDEWRRILVPRPDRNPLEVADVEWIPAEDQGPWGGMSRLSDHWAADGRYDGDSPQQQLSAFWSPSSD